MKYNKIILSFVLFISLLTLTNRSAHAQENSMKVISLAPSITETLVALGFEENIIGISNYCKALPGGREVPRLGVAKNFNAESILVLEPDLVLGLDSINLSYLPYHQIKTKNLTEIMNSFVIIAKLMNDEQKGLDLYNLSQAQINELQKEFSHMPKRKVLFVLFREDDKDGLIYQITAAGDDGYFSELLKILNCENAVKSPIAYPVLSFENIQALDPDEIVDVVAPELTSLQLDDWSNMPLKAVKNNDIYMTRLGVVPGPGFLEFLDELAEAFR